MSEATPRIVAHPELLEAEPLPLVRPGLARLWWALVPVGLVLVLGLLAGGWDWTMGLVVLVVWLGYAGLVWSDRRAFMQATGGALHVRNVLGMHQVKGPDVTSVVHQFNGRSPDFRLHTRQGKVWVPASRLERGHSTLFTWLDVHAPQAELDRQSSYWRSVLLESGKI